MASMTITRIEECPAQNHVTLEVTGDVAHTYRGEIDDLTAPISDGDKDAFIRVLLRFAKIGRTRAQVRAALANGFTVTV